ncbi:hypothetical protein KCU98_g504, partial [Aureobasidium melanogenum]
MFLLSLCVFLIAMLLGTATWASIMFHTTRALVPLIAAIILLSMIEGALVLATIQATNKTPMDYESHDLFTVLNRAASANPARPLDQALIHPAFRDYNQGSLNSTRNLSLPREHCSDVTFPATAPVIPVPGPYVPTGIITRSISAHRPLPPLPAKPDDAPVPPPHVENVKVNDVTILPLRIQKRDSATSESAVKRPEDVVDVKTVGKIGPKPGAFDATPVDLSSISEAEKIITGVGAEQSIEEEDQVRVEPTESGRGIESQAPQTPIHLVAPIIVVQQPTPTTPKSIQYPAATLATTPTIRLVSPYLEIPGRTGYGSRRKK